MVVGHKNPDTDSICSAVAYARFKSRVHHVTALACRAGNVNAQTAFALDYFGVDAPQLVGDVHPRIGDIMIPRSALLVLAPDTPLGEAKRIMLEKRFSFLPVVDSEDRCMGKVSTLGIAAILDELDEARTNRTLRVDLQEFLRRSEGRVAQPGPGEPEFLTGQLVTAAPATRGPAALGSPNGSGRPVIAVGTPEELRNLRSLQPAAMVACVSDAFPLPDEIAHSAPVAIETPVSSIQAAVLLFFSSPCSEFMEEPGRRFSSGDLLRDAEREINKSNLGGFMVESPDGRLAGVVTRTNFMTDPRRRVIMVDHNEFSQAIEGIEHAELMEVIDHHRIGSLHSNRPITVINRVIGSTCSIVADLFRQSRVEPDRATAGLMLSGVLSDTVILRSPTTTDADRELAAWLAELAGVAVDQYGEAMFRAGSSIAQLDADAIIGRDQKGYEEYGIRFSVSQIEMIGFAAFWERTDELHHGLGVFADRNGYEMAFLMVTDITVASTLLVCHASERALSLIAYPQVEPGVFELKGVLSRKKQVLPLLIDVLGRV